MKQNSLQYMIKTLTFSILAFTLFLSQNASAEIVDVKKWSTTADIAVVNGVTAGASEWFLAELPGDIIKNSSSATLSDLRVIDSTNTEIPYVIVRQGYSTELTETKVVPEGRAVKILENSLERGPRGQDRVMVLEIPLEGKVYNGINLEVSPQSTNFRKVVNIAVSDVQLGATSPAWREIESKPVIYNYSDRQGLFVQKTKINFIPASSRYIRLRFEQDPALVESGVQFTNNVIVDGVRLIYETDTVINGITVENYLAGAWVAETGVTEPAVVESVTENTTTKATEVIYKTNNPLGFVDATKITIKLDKDESNFKRQVTVQSGTRGEQGIVWKTVGTGQIYRINSPVFQGESTSIAFQPTAADYFKVIVQNNNDTALKVEGVAVVDLQKVAVLFKRDSKNLAGVTMLIGNSSAIPPTYEIQKTLSYFNSIVPEKVTVQNVKPNSLFTATEQVIPFAEKYKWALNTALIVFVLLIALLGWKYRSNKPESPTDQVTPHEN